MTPPCDQLLSHIVNKHGHGNRTKPDMTAGNCGNKTPSVQAKQGQFPPNLVGNSLPIAELEIERRKPHDMMNYDKAVMKCRKISEDIFKLMSSSDPGTFSVNIDYKYKLHNTLHKEIYLTVIGRKENLEDSLTLLYWILRFCLKLKKDYRSVKMEDVPREMWQILIYCAQTLYPPKMTKLFNATKEQNIWV